MVTHTNQQELPSSVVDMEINCLLTDVKLVWVTSLLTTFISSYWANETSIWSSAITDIFHYISVENKQFDLRTIYDIISIHEVRYGVLNNHGNHVCTHGVQ